MNREYRHIALLTTFLILVSGYAYCQNKPQLSRREAKNEVMDVMRRVVKYYSQYPQEKVYLHLDNTGYFKGETIWFAAYVTKCGFNKSEKRTGSPDFGFRDSDLSRVLYVDLLNPSGDIVQSHKFPINYGKANGQIHLDSILTSGFYEIRAYTRYMMNWDGDCAFSRVVPVFASPKHPGDYGNPSLDWQSYKNRLPDNRRQSDNDNHQEKKDRKRVHLYPEGGNLVRGLASRVAYTVMKDGEETFRGITDVVPECSGQNIKVIDDSGDSIDVALPDVINEGCVVRIDNNDDDFMALSVCNTDSIMNKVLAFAIMSEGEFELCDTFTAAGQYERTFYRKDFRGGVNELIVFSPDGHPLCERLFFVYPHGETDSIGITMQSSGLRPYGKVSMALHGRANSRISLSATDAASCVNGRYGDIATYLLLGSEVRGYVSHPEYYFEADDVRHRQNADLLMMVQGWKRYVWTDMTGESSREMRQEVEDGLYLKGQLKSKSSKDKPSFVNVNAYMFNRKGQTATGKGVTDKDGKFLFKVVNVFDGDYNLQLFTKKDDRRKNYWITLDRHFAPEPRFLSKAETEMLPKNGMTLLETGNGTASHQAGDSARNQPIYRTDQNNLLPTVTIKKTRRILGDPNHVTWYSENRGFEYSTVYYDCDRASDKIADEGKEQPWVYSWLASVNEFFRDALPEEGYYPHDPQMPPIDEGTIETDFLMQTNTGKSVNIYRDGYSYKGRPIIWILNNRYAGMTSAGSFKLVPDEHREGEYQNWLVLKPTIEAFPRFLNDVKSIYISEDINASLPYLNSSDATANAVTVFLYTHPTVSTESQKGLRKTHFQSYTERETFQMNDYSVLPPMEDFRRTIYWNPNIWTDKDGKATVEFWNNSSCSSLYISAEGISKDGKVIVGE